MRASLRRRLALGLTAALLTGCDDCSREADHEPAPEPEPTITDPRLPARPTVDAIDARWAAATIGRSVEPRSEGPTHIAWGVPCPLTYAVRWERLFDVTPDRLPAGPRTFAELRLSPHGEGATAEVTSLFTDHLTDGASTQGRTHAPTLRASLRWDAVGWSTVDPPNAVWSIDGSIPALGSILPALPRRLELGATVQWTVERFPTAAVERLERRRAEGKPTPRLRGDESSRTARVVNWLDVEGEPAVVLDATFERAVDEGGESLPRSLEAWRARWVVLARGRLLHAGLLANAWIGAQAEPGVERTRSGTIFVELRLVDACDGPVLARPPR